MSYRLWSKGLSVGFDVLQHCHRPPSRSPTQLTTYVINCWTTFSIARLAWMGVSTNENKHAPSITNCKYGSRHRAELRGR